MNLFPHLFLMASVPLIPLVALAAWALDMVLAGEPVQRAFIVGGLGIVIGLAVAGGLAVLFSRRLTASIAAAAQSAAAIGRGDVPGARPSSVSELATLHGALAQAATSLMLRTDERDLADAQRAHVLANELAARQLAESRNQAKDEFLAMLAHKLRNPRGAPVVETRGAPDAQPRETGVRSSHHLGRVEDLLDLNRMMTDRIPLDRQHVDLAEMARRCVAILRTGGRTNLHTVNVRTVPAWVDADVARLEQVITHLIVNALSYTPENGTIDVEVKAEGTHAVLEVRDSGIGISEQLLPHVFDVFVQGAVTFEARPGGLGTGLALVRRLVTLHGGTVTAASAGNGQGATLTVRLPRVAAPEFIAPVATSASPAAGERTVLVVDDHTDGRRMLCVMLNLFGYRILEAGDGAEGLRMARSEQPDVAIIDIGLPDMDGNEVARQLRADPSTSSIPLIALTGHGQEDDRRRAYDAGFDVHLVKPVNPDLLSEAVAESARRGNH